MFTYFIKRFLLIIPTFIGITLMVFSITRMVPGGPVERMMTQMKAQAMSAEGTGGGKILSQDQLISDEQIAQLNEFYGLDKPFIEAYYEWLVKFVQLDLGESSQYYDPVLDMILDKLPISAFYGAVTFLVTYLISIPLGYRKAMKHGSVFDSVSSVLIFAGYALPGYVVGVFLITYFAHGLEWFPMGGFVSDDFEFMDNPWLQFKDVIWHAALPLVCYLIGDFAVLTMTMKNNLMENMSSDYIRTAIAKGLPFNTAVKKHAMRNSLIPIASHFGTSLLFFMTGSFMIEVIFDIDGLGLLGYESIIQRDYPVVMGILGINALMLLIGTILSDICVALVDPRIKFGD